MSYTPVNLKKDYKNGDLFDEVRFNSDQTSIQQLLNLVAAQIQNLVDVQIPIESIDISKLTQDLILILNSVGDYETLTTNDKVTVVRAVNEVNTKAVNANSDIGDIEELTTALKDNLVIAINQINSSLIPKTTLEAAGDIIYASGANVPAKLSKGADKSVLKIKSGLPAWEAVLSSEVAALAGTKNVYSSTGDINYTETTYTKKMELTANVGGTLRIGFTIIGNSNYAYAQIYKNGVAYGTERVILQVGVFATFSEDLIFSSGDKIQIYCKVAAGTGTLRDLTVGVLNEVVA